MVVRFVLVWHLRRRQSGRLVAQQLVTRSEFEQNEETMGSQRRSRPVLGYNNALARWRASCHHWINPKFRRLIGHYRNAPNRIRTGRSTCGALNFQIIFLLIDLCGEHDRNLRMLN
jgi:hypothetical protein